MRLLVLGVDADGRSCVTEQRDTLDFNVIPGIPGSTIAKLFGSDVSPPKAAPSGAGRKIENAIPPGHVSWYVINHEPYGPGERHTAATELHHRSVIDMIFIIEGGGDMMLGDGAHPVGVGDCVLMPGTSHGLRPGPQGCRLMAFAIGATPA